MSFSPEGSASNLNNTSKLFGKDDAIEAILKNDRVGSGLKDDVFHRSSSFLSKEQLSNGSVSVIKDFKGVERTMFKASGELNGKPGMFEYIIDHDGTIIHQLFKPVY